MPVISTADLKKGSQTVLGAYRGATPAYNARTFYRDFASLKTLNHGTGPAITFTRASNATFFDANGVLQTAGNNVPRFDHDPATGASRGLLIEEARTNSLPNSQMVGAVAGSAGTAPTGWATTTSGAGLTRTIGTGTVNGMPYIDVSYSGTVSNGGSTLQLILDTQQSTAGYAASSGQTWTSSVYLALTSGNIPSGASLLLVTRGRQADNTISSPSDQTQITISPTSTLTRYTATRTFSTANTTKVTLDLRVNPIPDGATVNFTLRIAAPQLEQGAFATSYIPTTTAAATRSTDVAVVEPVSSFYNQSEGTMFAELELRGQLPSARYVQFDDTTNNNRIVLGLTSVSAVQNFAAVATVTTLSSSISGTIDAGTIHKMGAGFAANNMVSAVNGTLAPVDTSGAMPSGITRLRLGGQPSTAPRGHWLRKFAYYPKRLSNTLLQQLTT